MDQDLLVDVQIEEGRELIVELTRMGIDVAVAFWAKMPDNPSWTLYLGSETLGRKTVGDAFATIYTALGRIDPTGKSFSEMTISHSNVKPAPPGAAAEAARIRDRHRSARPIRLPRMSLGSIEIDEAIIYPQLSNFPSRQEVVQRVAELLSFDGPERPASITLKDGSSIWAVPTSIRRDIPGRVQIVLHDTVSDTDRTVSADDVLSIR